MRCGVAHALVALASFWCLSLLLLLLLLLL